MNANFALLFAGLCEIFPILFARKFSLNKGAKKLFYLVIMFFGFILSLVLLHFASKEISISVVYAVFTGIGASLALFVGVIFHKEKLSAKKIICLCLIIFSAICLKLV